MICMLATNRKTYDEVLTMKNASANGEVDWARVFGDENQYKMRYMQDIIYDFNEAAGQAEAQ